MLPFDLNHRHPGLSQEGEGSHAPGVGEDDRVDTTLDELLQANSFVLVRTVLVVEKDFVAVGDRLFLDRARDMGEEWIFRHAVRDVADRKRASRPESPRHDIGPITKAPRRFVDPLARIVCDIALEGERPRGGRLRHAGGARNIDKGNRLVQHRQSLTVQNANVTPISHPVKRK